MAAPRPYYGRPENQKNPGAANFHGQNREGAPHHPAPGNKDSARPAKPNPKDTPLGRMAASAPRQLPRPTPSTATPTAPRDENLKDLTLFAVNQNVREVNPRVTFSPAATGLIDVSRDIHQELRAHDPNIAKVLTPEVLDYYHTVLFWARAVDLKSQFGEQLTVAEDAFLTIIQKQPLTVLAPILSFLKSYGGILSKLESNSWPTFPDLPTTLVAGIGGYFGPITEDTHNLYEEIPCLGVLAYAVCQTLTNNNGAYASPLNTRQFAANGNLLGFRPLARRRDEARSFVEATGVTANAFPSTVANTSFHLGLVLAVSELLRECKTFKTTTTTITTLGSAGSQSQTIFLSSYPTDDDTLATHTEVRPSCLGRESTSHIGLAVYTCSQLLKAADTPNAAPPANTTPSWLCVTPIQPWAVPQPWIENRNTRRTLPDY